MYDVSKKKRITKQKNSMQIIPSILATSEEQFKKNLIEIGSAVEMVQIDIADGTFVPTVTAATPELASQFLQTKCELHLMVNDPGKYINSWAIVPNVTRVFFHVDCGADIDTTIAEIRKHNWTAGLVLNPEIMNSVIEPFLEKIQAVMFMGVHPGKQGAEFLPEVLQKAAKFKTQHPEIWVEWDGGVNETTIPEIIKTGIDAVCPGSAIFGNAKSPAENVALIKNKIKVYSLK